MSRSRRFWQTFARTDAVRRHEEVRTMKNALRLLALSPLGFALCACAASSAPPKNGADASGSMPASSALADTGDTEEDIALTAVPAAVLTAAQGAVSGITFSSAEREVEGGKTLYSLCGTANGKKYEVEVAADGTVVEVEDCDDCEECDDCDGPDDDD
jgi:hypothetical protein